MANELNPPIQPPLKLRGFREPFPAESGLKSKFVTVRAEFRTGRARAARQAETVSVNSDDVVEVEFADGPRLWLRGDDYRRQFAGALLRDATGAEVQAVPESLEVLPRGMQSRGPVKWALKSLKVLSVDLEQKTAVQIGKLVDGRTSPQRPGLGLYRCSMSTLKFGLTPLEPVKLSADQPFLSLDSRNSFQHLEQLWWTLVGGSVARVGGTSAALRRPCAGLRACHFLEEPN